MIDDQLVLSSEQVGERLDAVRALEFVVFRDPDPGQVAPLFRDRVERSRERLFLGEQVQARSHPFAP